MSPRAQTYSLLADIAVAIHAGFVLLVVGGQVLVLIGWIRKWFWTRNKVFRLLQLGGIGFVMLGTWFGIPCPLTILENKLRTWAGGGTYEMSFIGYWLNRFLFYTAPEWVFTLIYSVFAFIVVVTFFAYPPRRP